MALSRSPVDSMVQQPQKSSAKMVRILCSQSRLRCWSMASKMDRVRQSQSVAAARQPCLMPHVVRVWPDSRSRRKTYLAD